MDVERVKQYWDEQATDPGYESEFGPGMLIKNKYLARHRKATEERRFAELVQLRPDMDVLDVGCGTGRWAFYMSPRVHSVTATDISCEMIHACERLQASRQAGNVKFLVREAPDFLDLGRFSFVFLGGVLQCLPDDTVKNVALNAARVLRPGGLCLSRDTVTSRRTELSGHYPVVYRTAREYVETFREAGLDLVRSIRAYHMPEIVPKLMRLVPLRGHALDTAIRLDSVVMRTWVTSPLLKVYRMITKRGSGMVLDHTFFLYAPSRRAGRGES